MGKLNWQEIRPGYWRSESYSIGINATRDGYSWGPQGVIMTPDHPTLAAAQAACEQHAKPAEPLRFSAQEETLYFDEQKLEDEDGEDICIFDKELPALNSCLARAIAAATEAKDREIAAYDAELTKKDARIEELERQLAEKPKGGRWSICKHVGTEDKFDVLLDGKLPSLSLWWQCWKWAEAIDIAEVFNRFTVPATPSPATPSPAATVGDDEAAGRINHIAAMLMQGLLANPGGPIQANGASGWGWTNCKYQDVVDMTYDIVEEMVNRQRTKGTK